jgi:allophanate hydrolase
MNDLVDKVRAVYQRIRERGDDGVWIALVDEEDAVARTRSLGHANGPLHGWTFAVKDNIDVAGLPTTAACPQFSHVPTRNAFVVQRLLDAGAIVIGKTNLDQFATGLNGTRTPHTIPRNFFRSEFISGGSSSGSAIAVACGEVDFALGTDTAGSGRVPAAFNNLVGLKPTRGRWSTSGLLPACRSLDCITVLAKSLAEAVAVDRVVTADDEEDPYSRTRPPGFHPSTRCVAVLRRNQREFFGDEEYARLYDEAVERAEALGWEVCEFDYAPFLEAAALLYQGPWVAERAAALGDFLANHPESVNPVVRGIVEGGGSFSAEQAFVAQYRLADVIRRTRGLWKRCDAMLLPTVGTIYTVEEMLADPVVKNSHLGRYTNFVNLMDLCVVSVPTGWRSDGIPFGVSLIGPAWTDEKLARLAAEILGEATPPAEPGVKVAVVGAHLRGQPLNGQLLELGASFLEQSRTAPCYRLFALPGTTPPKPGMIRASDGGSIEVEIWSLSETAFGRFVACVPTPLGFGSVELASGEWVKGFLCEPWAVAEARDITSFGGWRTFLERGL